MIASQLSLDDSWAPGRPRRKATAPAPAVQERRCRTLREAEELLDWLEANGHSGSSFVCTGHGFVVRSR
jgi:hypothetical protein